MAEALIAFRGEVRCVRAAGPLGLTLLGHARAHEGVASALAFSAAAPSGLPARLTDARVEQLSAGQYRLVSAEGQWPVSARAVHLTREVAEEFYRALPPRPVPAGKRLFWRCVLALAGSRAGLALLRALRR